MECDMCGKAASSKIRLRCPTCARMALYPLRVEQITVLLDKEAMGRRVEAALQVGDSKMPRESLSLSGKIIDTYDCAKASELGQILSDSAALKERVDLINKRAQALRSDMEECQARIKAQNVANSRRRSDAGSATYGLHERDIKELESVEASVRRIRRRWEMKHNDIVEGRAVLCRPAARLAGLRRHRRSREDGTIREFYTIGSGIPIFDLKELHIAKPEELTASLTLLAYLTVRAANYLALRLPAEITLPHKDYPLATIFSPQASYYSQHVPFPGTTPTTSSTSSPIASRSFDARPMPTPRPLFLRVPLAKLSKDDSKAYSMFIEGVTLLAWNIAWLCKTQAMSGFDSEWDICAVGRNLWNLLLTEPGQQSSFPAFQQESGKASIKPPADNPPRRFGQLSHGTAHSFFDSSDGKRLMHEWRLHTPMRSILKIREFLNNELQKAEWEVLQEAEWNVDGGEGNGDEAILVGGKRFGEDRLTAAGTPVNVGAKSPFWNITESEASNSRTGKPAPRTEMTSRAAPSSTGQVLSSYKTQGWTKLRTRSSGEQ